MVREILLYWMNLATTQWCFRSDGPPNQSSYKLLLPQRGCSIHACKKFFSIFHDMYMHTDICIYAYWWVQPISDLLQGRVTIWRSLTVVMMVVVHSAFPWAKSVMVSTTVDVTRMRIPLSATVPLVSRITQWSLNYFFLTS